MVWSPMDAMPERAKEAANSYIIPSSVNLNLPVEELKLDSATKNDGLSNLYPMRNYQQRASFISESDSVSDEEDFMRRRRQSIMTYNSENRAPDSASRGSYMEKRLEESKFLQQEAEDAQKLERNQGIDNTQRGEESLVIEQEAPKLAVEEEKESRALYPTIPEGKKQKGFYKHKNLWRARLWVPDIGEIYLGHYRSREEAALAFDRAAIAMRTYEVAAKQGLNYSVDTYRDEYRMLEELGIEKVAMNLRMNAESDGKVEVSDAQNEDKKLV